MPSSATRGQRLSLRVDDGDVARRGCSRRATRAIEEPIRPMPIEGDALSKSGFSASALRLFSLEFGERRHHAAVGLLGADGQAQRIREAVGGDPAQD